MTVGILLLASLQDILSGGGKSSVEVLFASGVSDETFGAGCALGTALDEAGWGLYSTSVLPQVLSSTARYIGAPSKSVTVSDSPFEAEGVSSTSNSLTLLARLAFSGRLYEAYQNGGHGVVAWEKVVGAACEERIKKWTSDFSSDATTEIQVSFDFFHCYRLILMNRIDL